MSKKPVGHPYTFSKASSNACSILPHSVVICKLCNGLAVKPTYLQCKHSFCDLCLVNYVKIKKYQESLDFPCPFCGNLSAPPWGIWHLSDKILACSHDEFYQTWKYQPMCDHCATEGFYATAGRRCLQCQVNLCDTCSYTHSVMIATQSHCVTNLMCKVGKYNQRKNQNQDSETDLFSTQGHYISPV
ncbi:hypothetical protein EB796_001193 [Bugula neritina]|uniref:RING-type domain-containing protein n=1 Tax=Bugula neritina TaxID=10212 RepID=A0A7J7KQL5_BUGNE|nr:hypothetical protein EB796_001193 [Bugula neritina]